MDISQWRLDMIGVVAVAKPEGSWEVEFYPSERLPMEDGDVNATKDISAVVKDLKGNSNTSSGERKSKLTAVWIPGGADGRQTPPDVQPGEMLEIWRFADSERYFWKTYKNNPTLRRLEHVVYAYSNLTAFGVKMSAESSYGYCFSTLNKLMSIWTSKSDGEAFKYDFQFDTKNSKFKVGDDVDNLFAINSSEDEVYLQNSPGSYLKLHEQKMTGYASNQVTMLSDGTIELLAPNVNIGGSGGVSTVSQGTVSTKAQGYSVETPIAEFSDKIHVGGDGQFDADVSVGGTLQAGNIVASSISIGGRSMRSAPQSVGDIIQDLRDQIQRLESRLEANGL
jgi:hypothetical protein